MLSLFFHIITLTIISFSTITSNNLPRHNKLSLKLIHRDSICSPFHNPIPSNPNHLSHARTKSHTQPPSTPSSKIIESSIIIDDHDSIRAPVIPFTDSTVFLVNVSIGRPPQPLLLAMDTGSQLTWVHCTRCKGCQLFDPEESITYINIPRYMPQCASFGSHTYQDDPSRCKFSIRYGDSSTSDGILALETLTLETSTGGLVQIPDLVLGCALDTQGTVMDLSGVLALESTNRYSLVSRLGNRFSYCIGNISDASYMYNHLVLGEGAILEGGSTPLRIKDGHIFLTLEGISIGEKRIELNREEFLFNVVIDSGTTRSQLLRSAYEPLIAEVERLMDGVLTRIEVRGAEDMVCYRGDLERDLKGFPLVTFYLADGVELYLEAEGLFQRTRDGSAFCTMVSESDENMIGVLAQQYYNVGYDLDAKRVSFLRIDCELLED